MKKFDLKTGLFFGLGMSIFLIFQDLLTADNFTGKIVGKAVLSGLIAGTIAGLLFSLIIRWFKSSKFIDTTTEIDIQPNENVLFQTPANHFKGLEGVGGKLYLTNKRLVFKSHKFNIQNHELSFDLTDIVKVERNKTLNIINNGLIITSKNNQTDRFIVEKANEWMEKLRNRHSDQREESVTNDDRLAERSRSQNC